ncbi:MAG: esterase [Chloroflexi bacterium]|nr:esterase [Chloroflexota bacterium]
MTQGNQQEQQEHRYREELIPFRARDGFQCNLIHVQGKTPHKGPVLLVPGSGVRANLFRPPVETTIVDYLVAHDYDVWLENWRASIDLPHNFWTLDQGALYDHPEAVKTVVERTGWDKIKAVIHCQGSTSFMMAAVAGLVPQVTTIVSNAVSLHTVVPALSHFKLEVGFPLISPFTRYIDSQWGLHAPSGIAKAVNFCAEMMYHECDNLVCKNVSFMYGTLWRHENLNNETHEWIKREFAHAPLSFFKQIAQCIQVGHLVSVEGERALPEDYVAQSPQTDARIAFFVGEEQQCFLPESQVRSFQFFDKRRQDYHSLHILPRYGHLDVFIGQNASKDVFPLIVQELDKPC